MRITIQSIPHKDQRYDTVGDWQWGETDTGKALLITVSDLGDDKMNALVAIHELVEALLCKFNNPEITTEEVDAFDFAHPELEEPGEDINAPYIDQHLMAKHIEKELAIDLGVKWEDYEERIKSLDNRRETDK